MWALIGLFFIIGYPLSRLLDLLLGKGHGTFYRRAELQALVDIHGPPLPIHTEGVAADPEHPTYVVFHFLFHNFQIICSFFSEPRFQ